MDAISTTRINLTVSLLHALITPQGTQSAGGISTISLFFHVIFQVSQVMVHEFPYPVFYHLVHALGVNSNFRIVPSWPMHQYYLMRTKDVPHFAYRAWFEHFISTPKGRSHVWPWEPKDHEWMLSQLLQ